MKGLLIAALIGAVSILTSCTSSSNFATGTIDYGIVVSNINKSVDFYKSIGFEEVATFKVPKSVTGDAGLLSYKDVKIHVMALDGDESGTKVKLMQTSGKHREQAQAYIDSTYGMSYQTIFVRDLTPVLANLEEKNIKVLAKGPVDLTPVGFAPNYLVCVRDPDGNIIEFVGPMTK